MDIKLLKKLCSIFSPSGNEIEMKTFIEDYITQHQDNWHVQPTLISGEELQDCLLLVFGKPRVAVFAHMDTTGFTVRYQNQLIPIGSPVIKDGYRVVGSDNLGPVECSLKVDKEGHIFHDFGRGIERGTELIFKPDFKIGSDYIQSSYLDNRVGIFNALELSKSMENGLIAFSCWEEHGGGSVPFLIKYIYEKFGITKTLISDVTWVTDGIQLGDGVVISLRDHNIPRKSYTDQIISIAKKSGITFQLEVEDSGSSDGREVQHSPYPIDWCFIGAPEVNVHSPKEKVNKKDLEAMISLYKVLTKSL